MRLKRLKSGFTLRPPKLPLQERSGRSRPGFTLIEIIVASAIAALVGATLLTVLRRQERFYSSSSEMLQVRTQLRDAADVLAADIRGAAVSRYGLPLMTDSAMELFTGIGTSIVCTTPAGPVLFLPPTALSSGTVLTSLLASPDTGDLALIYAMPGGIPDSGQWVESRITAFASRAVSTSCPPSTGFTSLADAAAGRKGYMVTLSSMLPGVRKGAPVRFVRRARYSLYRSSDGGWYLGYRRCSAIGPSACSTIQPVSGPYLAYGSSGSGTSGLAFRYFNAAGSELLDAAASAMTARVDIVLRGETARAVALTGDARVRYRDSAVVTISPRNRAR